MGINISNKRTKNSCMVLFWFSIFLISLMVLNVNINYAGQMGAGNHFNKNNNRIKNLSIEERVECQKAIEQVYWRNRIWPAGNAEAKPAIESMMPFSAIKEKVDDALLKSSALEYYWQRPLSAQQLQNEIQRMAKNSKQPAVLKELWTALNNDPHLIAECLARPILADRLMRKWYGFDERFHGELKAGIKEELRRYSQASQMKLLHGAYYEMEYIMRNDKTGDGNNDEQIILDKEEWESFIEKLREEFGINKDRTANESLSMEDLPENRMSVLQEEPDRFYSKAIINKEQTRIKIAMVVWNKVPFDSWWEKAKSRMRRVLQEPAGEYVLPPITGFACTPDTWLPTDLPMDTRRQHTTVWTGPEMIIWGGYNGSGYLNTGGRYNPGTDDWTVTAMNNVPTGRRQHSAVWDGTEMIVWGGSCGTTCSYNTGGRYNPATGILGSWTATSVGTNVPTSRYSHTAVWTGTEMIVWGGYNGTTYFNTGARYNPGTDSWTPTTQTGVPSIRRLHTAIWTGSRMIVWGGTTATATNTGGIYDPVANTWTNTSTSTGVPEARYSHTAVFASYGSPVTNEMIVWGGMGPSSGYVNTGGRLNVATNVWTATSTVGAPGIRFEHKAVWTGTRMIVWGGYDGIQLNTGGRYNPADNTWAPTTLTNAPSARYQHTAEWTGTEMIIFGGYGPAGYYNTGGRYEPNSDLWVITYVSLAPGARDMHTTIWTGTEMIAWGGYNGTYLNSGARYTLSTDVWVPVSTTDAPFARIEHSAVWTGSLMIVWGGFDGTNALNDGFKYNPAGNTWTAISMVDVPDVRRRHTAVWSGSEMIVWGGCSGNPCNIYLNTGSKYNPTIDSWIATPTTGAPSSRESHSAIWTGTEMIVWGGYNGAYLGTGSRYNPLSDLWAPTTTSSAPTARQRHTAVWTGTEMIVWGGSAGATYYNTGARYNPGSNSWTALSTTNAPSAREYHTSLIIGTDMVVWGGYDFSGNFFNTGAKYILSSDSWTSTSLIEAPSARDFHTAVGNNSQMIVWGGVGTSFTYCNTGGIYCVNIPSTAPLEATSLYVSKSTGENIIIAYSAPCNATDDIIYWGKTPGAMTSISWTGQQCAIGTGGTYTLDTGALNPGEMMYLVVVGNNSTVEGSYGKNSSGAERPEAIGLPGCDYPQDVTGSC